MTNIVLRQIDLLTPFDQTAQNFGVNVELSTDNQKLSKNVFRAKGWLSDIFQKKEISMFSGQNE